MFDNFQRDVLSYGYILMNITWEMVLDYIIIYVINLINVE